MAAAGAKSVKGGNFQIFEEFALRSKADIRLDTVVKDIQTSLEYNEDGEVVTRYILESDSGHMESFDAVIIAAPLVRSLHHCSSFNETTNSCLYQQSTNLKCFQRPQYPKYKKVHVTLIAGVPNPTKFGKSSSDVPSTIVTTGPPYRM